jgi:hypothetical protein
LHGRCTCRWVIEHYKTGRWILGYKKKIGTNLKVGRSADVKGKARPLSMQ